MMRNYEFKDIDEFSYEKNLLEKTNPVLIMNFNKVANWIKENCPHLNGAFETNHNPYYWIQLVVEDGKSYLEWGSHGWGYEHSLSTTETATITRGSMQFKPYAFKGLQFYRNDILEEFLKQWKSIKEKIILENASQSNVYSKDFEV